MRIPLCLKIALVAILLFLSVASYAQQQRIVINEVMYAPISPEPEWVELYNADTITFNLKNWHISDRITTIKLPSIILTPGSYLLVTKDSNALKAKYSLSDVAIIQGKLPTYNNDGDQVILSDSLNNTIDSFEYNVDWGGGGGGLSLERYDVFAKSDSINFSSSVADSGATPGLPNSTRRRVTDISASRIEVISSVTNVVTLRLIIQNRGRVLASQIPYKLIRKRQTLPLVIGTTTTFVEPLAFDTIIFDWTDGTFGSSSLSLITNQPDDEFRKNDTITQDIFLPILPRSVVINELMIEPISSSCQWIELYNQSNNLLDLSGASISIVNNDTTFRYIIDSIVLLPKSYGIISSSTKIFSSYNNLHPSPEIFIKTTSSFHLQPNGSSVVLSNRDKSVIDSMYYDDTYYSTSLSSTQGISLERKRAAATITEKSNWGSCVDNLGATPLALNSLSIDSNALHTLAKVTVSPNPFSPDDDHFDDQTIITVELPNENEELVSLKLYDERGRLRRIITQEHRIVSTGEISFDGKDDHGVPLPMGLYTLITESKNGAIQTSRNGIVIAKRKK